MNLIMEEDEIRQLNLNETNLVTGGIGTGIGGLFSPTNLLNARNFAGGLGLLYASYKIGWEIGSFGYSTYNRYKYNIR